MCDPVSMSALAVASTTASAFAANAQATANEEVAQRNAGNQAEEQKAAAEIELSERVKTRNAQRSRAVAANAEAGVGGQSFALGLQQIEGQFNQDAATVEQNLGFRQRATQGRLDQAFATSGRVGPVAAGLSIASAGVNGYSSGLNIAAARERTKT